VGSAHEQDIRIPLLDDCTNHLGVGFNGEILQHWGLGYNYLVGPELGALLGERRLFMTKKDSG
jgi:hypothetical protein